MVVLPLGIRRQRRACPVAEHDQAARWPCRTFATAHADAIGKQRAVPGLRHVTDSLSGLFKSGLSRFGLQLEAPPQPAEHPLVVVFVVGGISMREIRDLQVRQ